MAELTEKEAFELYIEHNRHSSEAARCIALLRKDTRFLDIVKAHELLAQQAARLFVLSVMKGVPGHVL